MKEAFLNDELWILTFGGGFQRANVYKGKIPAPVRKEFRNALRKKIEALVKDKYHSEVSEEEHLENIQAIVEFSKENNFKGYIIPINFGVAQKLLNLYLKYSWCSGRITAVPVHFPIDRLVQEALNKEAKDLDIPKCKIKAWTQFDDEIDYLEIIQFAKDVRDKQHPKKSLAEMELEIFTRR